MTTELERQLLDLKQGDHICLIYESTAQQLASAIPFLKEGLIGGKHCLHVADERTIAAITQALTAAGVNVAQERQSGALQMLTARESYLKKGLFEPQMMIDFLRLARLGRSPMDFAACGPRGRCTGSSGRIPNLSDSSSSRPCSTSSWPTAGSCSWASTISRFSTSRSFMMSCGPIR